VNWIRWAASSLAVLLASAVLAGEERLPEPPRPLDLARCLERAAEANPLIAMDAASADAAVIALGGGAVAEPGAMEKLLDRGEVVFLKLDPATLHRRIGDPGSRPLLAGLDDAAQIEELGTRLADRLPFYQRARIQVDALGTIDEVVDRIIDELAIP